MKIFKTISEIRKFTKSVSCENKTMGFVPTMGYLHAGHLSLIKKSKQENDITIVSIYVNPIQFGANEDFSKYPRNIEQDILLLTEEGVDCLFLPDSEEIYPSGYLTYVLVEKLTEGLCGKTRIGHFRGVTTIVCKLFNIIRPNKAYFGMKDAQQAIVIKKMVLDLNMEIEVVVCPVVREKDGLAMSSRNTYLSKEERNAATVLYKSLCEAKTQIENGETNADKIINSIKQTINAQKLAKIEYIEIVDGNTLENVKKITNYTLIAIAVKIGYTRLIDNIIIS